MISILHDTIHAMKQTEYQFTSTDLERNLSGFAEKGITELVLHDPLFSSDRSRLLHFLQAVAKDAPELYVTVPVRASVLDMDVCRAAANIFCSLDIPLTGQSRDSSDGPVYLFDKKLFAKKADMLNKAGLVFGFDMEYAALPGDSLKLFRDRLDFALSLYPNHIDFRQLEQEQSAVHPTGMFSPQDIRFARDIAFACKTFYTCGRAVPWFLPVLEPLKIQGSRFLADFAEWQRCDNCGPGSDFKPEATAHTEIEKMQLVFLGNKYEEKHHESLFTAVRDIVRLNGAFARLSGEGTECELDTAYSPDDLLSPEAAGIVPFVENVLLEPCRVKVFQGGDGPDYRIIN